MNLDDEARLESEFLQTALKRSELLRDKEAKKANQEYDRLHKIKAALRQLPDRGHSALSRIATTTDDQDVTILAAAALLAVDEEFATRLLEQVQQRGGIPALTAELTLREWRAGSIREYWS